MKSKKINMTLDERELHKLEELMEKFGTTRPNMIMRMALSQLYVNSSK